MTTESITAIEKSLEEISTQLQRVRILPDIADNQLGREKEFLVRNLEEDCRSILTRLSTILGSDESFLKISDYAGRQEVRNNLDELRSSLLHLNSLEAANTINEIWVVFQQIEKLKPIILSFEKALPAEQLKQINTLIENEHKILNQTAAEAVAGAFQKRLESAQSWIFWVLPLVGAGTLFAAGAFFIYYSSINNMDPEEISLAQSLPRLAFTSILVSAGAFCLRQYIRNRNILDDYNYKAAVAESIDPTLAVLDTRDQGIYLKAAFEAIHQHPLARNHEPHTSVKGLINRLQPQATANVK